MKEIDLNQKAWLLSLTLIHFIPFIPVKISSSGLYYPIKIFI
jgi:hypothetical protein